MWKLTHRLAALPVAVALAVAAGCASPATGPSGASTSAPPLMAAPSDDALPEPTARALAALLEEWVAGRNGTGVTAAVVSPEGSWSGAAGADAADVPLQPESAMAIGSITKTFTAAQVLHLVEDGLVDLDGPVSDYVDLPFDSRGATMRQVLGMRAGFPAWDPFEDVLAVEGADLSRSWTTQDILAGIEPGSPRLGQQGGSFTYNNLNYVVLTALIEQVTGEPYATVVRRELIDPAGLPRVWVQDAETPQPPLTVGESSRLTAVVDAGGPYVPSRAMASAASGAGGIAADAPSTARWGYLLFGGHVIDPDLVEQMTDAGPEGYGLGAVASEVDGVRVVGHDGSTQSHHGALMVWPESQVSVAVLVPNLAGIHLGDGTDAWGLAAQLRERVVGAREG